MNELAQRSVSFYSDDLLVIRQDGVDFTPVKPVCDILGIDWNGQYQRIMRDEVLSEGMCVIHMPSARGVQQMVCLPLDFLNGWLFGVSADRIKPENRENLIRYKRECYRVLSQAFTGQVQTQPTDSARLAAIEARLTAMEAKRGKRGPYRVPTGPREITAPRPWVEDAVILSYLEITHKSQDMLTNTEIAVHLEAQGVDLGGEMRWKQVRVARAMGQTGVYKRQTRTHPVPHGHASWVWVGVRLLARV